MKNWICKVADCSIVFGSHQSFRKKLMRGKAIIFYVSFLALLLWPVQKECFLQEVLSSSLKNWFSSVRKLWSGNWGAGTHQIGRALHCFFMSWWIPLLNDAIPAFTGLRKYSFKAIFTFSYYFLLKTHCSSTKFHQFLVLSNNGWWRPTHKYTIPLIVCPPSLRCSKQ